MWRWGKRSNFPGIQYLQSQAGRNYFNVHILDTIYWGNIFGRMWHCTDGDQWEPRTAITWHCGPIRERDTGRDGGRMMYFIEIQCGEGSAQSGDIGSRESGYNLYQFIPVPGFRCHFYLSRNERIFHIEILWFSTVLWQCFYLKTASCVKGSL